MAHHPLDPEIRKQVADELGLYVYALIDPRTAVPFYVGKGRGERFAAHGYEAMYDFELEIDSEASRSSKISKIQEIWAAGLEPEIWIIRHGMKSAPEYTAVEAASIDLFHSFPVLATVEGVRRLPNQHLAQLTNARKEANRGRGIIRLTDLIEEKAAPLLETTMPLLTITLKPWQEIPHGEVMPGGRQRFGYGYKNEWLPSEERRKNYDNIALSASGWWKIKAERVNESKIEYAVVLYRGVTRALLRIVPDSWVRDSTTGRSAFEYEVVECGAVFEETVGEFGHREPRRKNGTQNIFYWPRNT